MKTKPAAGASAQTILPGDGEYDAARRIWNGTVDRRPRRIVRCTDAAQVAAALKGALAEGAELAIRGGGHSLPGFSTTEGGVVVDLSSMREVAVDPKRREAAVGGGARWSDFDGATWPHRLLTTGGLVSTTGVGGLTLGGGIGWLTRLCGLSCDNLVGAQVVLADGGIVEAGEAGNEDLLWALRGGGGNFGVVTRFDLRLHPVAAIAGGLLLFPLDRVRQVAERYREWAEGLPDELSTVLMLLTAPDEDFVPRDLRGRPAVAVAGCHAGGPTAADLDLQAMRDLNPAVDMFGPMGYPELQSMFDAALPAGDRYYFKGGFVYDLPDDLVSALASHLEAAPGPRCDIDLHHMGGAAGRVPIEASAFPDRRSAYSFNVIAAWTDPGADDAHRDWARTGADILQRHGPATTYGNFSSEEIDVAAAFGASTYRRLLEAKRKYDPNNMFRLNQNIDPRPSS